MFYENVIFFVFKTEKQNTIFDYQRILVLNNITLLKKITKQTLNLIFLTIIIIFFRSLGF